MLLLFTAFHPGEIWPDNRGVHINAHGGGFLYDRGVYYWFGEHKVEGAEGNTAQVGVHVYSSTDLYNWTDRGIALAISEDPTSDIVKGCVIERPKVIWNDRTRKYVMWFHLELKGKGYSAARTAVAVSEHVTGPYRFVRSFRPNAGKDPLSLSPETGDLNSFERDKPGGQMSRDMTLFVDDDLRAYLLAASEENQTLHISELSDDYLEVTGKFTRAFIGRSMEAPAVFKRQGRYYIVGSGCTGWDPNPAHSAVADSIWGPWKELGNPCLGSDVDAATTFHSQSTYVIPVVGKKDAFIFAADRWRPKNAIDGRYVWLPIEFESDVPKIRWREKWDLSVFD